MTDEKGRPDPSADQTTGPPSVLHAVEEKTGVAPKVLLRDVGSSHGASPVIDASAQGNHKLPPSKGNYQILGQIAKGGVGVILKTHDTDLGRDVAMKVLLHDHADKPNVLQRFVEEAQIGGQLQHPGIVPVYEMGLMADERPYFTMKLVKGKTLQALLSDRADPDEDRRRFLQIFEQICQTLAYAHSRRVIHRDLKPANIMVGAFGEVQVVDWGLAKVMPEGGIDDEIAAQRQPDHQTQVSIIETIRSSGSSSAGSQSLVGTVMGTPAYMPPEQAMGEVDHLDERADVFSLGAILCEMLTGKPPYIGAHDKVLMEAARAMQDNARERLATCGADPVLIDLTERCLAPAKHIRPRNAEALVKEVDDFLTSQSRKAREAEVAAARAVQERKARRMTLALAATILLAVVAGGWFLRTSELEAIGRRAQTTAQINTHLEQAQLLRGQGELDAAVLAGERAESVLAAATDVDPELRSHVNEFLADVRGEAEAARVAAASESLRAEFLAEVRSLSEDSPVWSRSGEANLRTDLRTAAAFTSIGVDVFAEDDQGVVARLLGMGDAEAIGVALDDWARVKVVLEGYGTPGFQRLIQLAMVIDPDPVRVRMRRAFLTDDRLELEALAASAEARESWPPATAITFRMYLFTLGHMSIDVEPLLTACHRRHPGHPQINMLLAFENITDDPDPEQGLFYASAAYSLDPDARGPAVLTAMALADNGEYERAVDVYLRALELHPGQAWLEEGWAFNQFQKRLQTREAEPQQMRLLDEILKRRPDNETALNNIAWTLAKRPGMAEADYQRAVTLAFRAVELTPEDAIPWNTLGVALYRIGDDRGSIDALAESIRIEGGYAGDYFFQAMAHHRQGRQDLARELYDKGMTVWADSIETGDDVWEDELFAQEVVAALGLDSGP